MCPQVLRFRNEGQKLAELLAAGAARLHQGIEYFTIEGGIGCTLSLFKRCQIATARPFEQDAAMRGCVRTGFFRGAVVKQPARFRAAE